MSGPEGCRCLLTLVLLIATLSAARAQNAPANPATTERNAPGSQKPPDPAIPIPGPDTAPIRPPLTVKQKFDYAVRRGFGPVAIGGAFATGAYQQWLNHNKGYGQGADGYFSRVGSRYGKTASKHMIGSFALASIFGQDPRYNRSNLAGRRSRLFYAFSRVLITRADNGTTQFNISGVGGTAGAAFLSNTWHFPPDNTAGRALKRTGVSLGLEGVRNVIREFWPDIRRVFD